MKKVIHALLVDTPNRRVQVVEINPDDPLRSAYDLLGCEEIQPGCRLSSGDTLYVDGEALVLRPDAPRFTFKDEEFLGSGLIVNDLMEEWTAPHSPLRALTKAVDFGPEPTLSEPPFGAREIIIGMLDGAFHHFTKSDFQTFSGAREGAVIADMSGWTVIVCAGDGGDGDRDAICAHAYFYGNGSAESADRNYCLTVRGWEEI